MTFPKHIASSDRGQPVGVGLKSEHYGHVLEASPDVAFFEVHAENYMMDGGAHHRYLQAIAERYRLSVHGVGMSLGSAEGLDRAHVARFKGLVERYSPWLISEHLAWSRAGKTYLNDLLPLPLTEESLSTVADNIAMLQDALGRKLLVENPSSYMAFTSSDIPEPEFLTRLADQTGCGILLDVNNVYVSGKNMGWDVAAYLDAIPSALVGEIHLAGHLLKDVDGVPLRIDDHGSRVTDDVWHHFENLIARIGPRPTLVEWDTDIPDFKTLKAEAHQARAIMDKIAAGRATSPQEGTHHG